MITLGVIISIDNNNNFCKVRLPTLEGAGNKKTVELSATQMLPPGIGAGYEEGDVVFVSFVDNTLGRPVILGQLYKGPGKGTKIDNIGSDQDISLGCAKNVACEELLVKNKASIPLETILTGNSAEQNMSIDSLVNRIKVLEDQLTTFKLLTAAYASCSVIPANPLTSAVAASLIGAVGEDAINDAIANIAKLNQNNK